VPRRVPGDAGGAAPVGLVAPPAHAEAPARTTNRKAHIGHRAGGVSVRRTGVSRCTWVLPTWLRFGRGLVFMAYFETTASRPRAHNNTRPVDVHVAPQCSSGLGHSPHSARSESLSLPRRWCGRAAPLGEGEDRAHAEAGPAYRAPHWLRGAGAAESARTTTFHRRMCRGRSVAARRSYPSSRRVSRTAA